MTAVHGFRAVRDALDAAEVQRLVVSSPSNADVAAVVVAQLADRFAAAGRHVLVVDAAFERRTLSGKTGLADEAGLADVIAGRVDLADAISFATGRAFAVLPAGRRQDGEDVLAMRAAATTMDELARGFVTVLVAAPPVLEDGDAALVGALVGHTLVPVAARRERRAALTEAVARLRLKGATLEGVVLLHGSLSEEQLPAIRSAATSMAETRREAAPSRLEDDLVGNIRLQLPLHSLSLRYPFPEAADRADAAVPLDGPHAVSSRRDSNSS